MIKAERVSKWFGDVVAVSDVSFEVGPGVTALLGPNGAGKSTMLRMLCGLTPPSKGTIRLLGKDPRSHPGLYRRVGLVPQQEALFDHLTCAEFVTICARLRKVDQPGAAAVRALEQVELDPGLKRPIRTYSKGMRQRVKVAQALVGDPEILVLDEPLNGLDPRQRIHLVNVFRELGAQGRCVLVSSHVLEEVEKFGSRVLVVAQGRLAAEGDFHAIRELMDDRPHRLRVRTAASGRLAAALVESGLAVGVRIAGADGRGPGEIVFVDASDVAGFRRGVAATARKARARIYEITPLDDDLESVFRYLVGRSR